MPCGVRVVGLFCCLGLELTNYPAATPALGGPFLQEFTRNPGPGILRAPGLCSLKDAPRALAEEKMRLVGPLVCPAPEG
jgi:hypothetical protein